MSVRSVVAVAAVLAALGSGSVPALANVPLHPGAGCPGAAMEGGGDNLVIRYAPSCGRFGDHHNTPHGLSGANSRVPTAAGIPPGQPYLPGATAPRGS